MFGNGIERILGRCSLVAKTRQASFDLALGGVGQRRRGFVDLLREAIDRLNNSLFDTVDGVVRTNDEQN